MAMNLVARLRTLHRLALGLNRRNHDFGIALNPPHLVALVDNKSATKLALAARQVPTPQTFGRFRSVAELRTLGDALRNHTSFVMKPARGAGGEGIVVVTGRKGNTFIKASGETLHWNDLRAHAAEILVGAYALNQTYDEVLIEERLELHPDLARFVFRGIPDIRILVAYGVPILAMMRLPTRRSDGRANLHLGGVGVGVDLESGQATHAVWGEKPVVAHPDTQAPLRELQVPQWQSLLEVAAACFDCVPLGYFGVDLVLDPHVGPCVLELNARPGLAIQLANHVGLRPLLTALHSKLAHQNGLGAEDRVRLGLEVYRAHKAETASRA
ncbi:MAG: alpha-L-glutamate ligase-like protein [Candidatus Binatia bacterium]|nr:alpha-L-glutamate ligase-like protein [Candidatus Binatia bacterium]